MDRVSYMRFPYRDVTTTLALAESLLALTPALDGVESGRLRLEGAMTLMQEARAQLPPKPDKMSADYRLDRCWRALDQLCAIYRDIAPYAPEQARAAEAVEQGVFGDEGMSFLTLPYKSEWVESKRRLERIDADIEAKINALGGGEVLAALRQSHQEYGEVIGMTGEAQESKPRLLEPLKALRDAIQFYTICLLALAVDEASEATVEKALSPLLELR